MKMLTGIFCSKFIYYVANANTPAFKRWLGFLDKIAGVKCLFEERIFKNQLNSEHFSMNRMVQSLATGKNVREIF